MLAAIRGHHERYDGFGYPDGTIGEQTPRLARLIAVVDSYDAMTSARAYRGRRRPTALAVLAQEAGRHFDPHLVAAFIEMMQREPASL